MDIAMYTVLKVLSFSNQMTANNAKDNLVFTADSFCARTQLVVICIPLPETIAVA